MLRARLARCLPGVVSRTGRLAVVLAAGVSLAATSDAGAVELVQVGGQFERPIYATAPRQDFDRLFVVERAGTIHVVVHGETQSQPFLEIPTEVLTAGEGGLLSMAFHPGYADNRRFYVFYTVAREGDPTGGVIRVDEFRRSTTDPNQALPESRRRVLRIPHPLRQRHYGGQLQFGPDGRLYISTGDGGGLDDADRNAQDRSSLLGKLLRINPLPGADRAYRIPPDNPFVDRPGRDEIFATGLRNPFRFSFDRLSGYLFLGDVGQGLAEEVDVLPPWRDGANFGWSCFEGFTRNSDVECGRIRHRRPVFEYMHSDPGCDSITGGYVVRSPELRSIAGSYVYGDYCRGQLWTLGIDENGELRNEPYLSVNPFELVSFGEDALRRLYVVLMKSGQVLRLVDEGAGT